MGCKGTDKRKVGMEYCAFLIALFEHAAGALVNVPANQHHCLASWWRDYLKTKCPLFYAEVIKEADTIHKALLLQAVCIYLNQGTLFLFTTLSMAGKGYTGSWPHSKDS